MDITLPTAKSGIFASLYRHKLAFIVAAFGGVISVLMFFAVQLELCWEQTAFLCYSEWRAWLALGEGVLLTTMASTVLYLYIDRTDRLAAYALELECSNRDLDSFASIASHDLKEPLRTIQSYTALTLRREELSENGQHYLNTVSETSAYMQEILYHLRHYARLGNQQEGHDEVACMEKLFDQAQITLKQLITERSAQLTGEHLPQLIGSRVQLLQLLQNLITNAIRYCPPERIPQILFTANRIKNGWEFRLSDNGEGVPREAREQIFQPFKRYSKQKVSGSGLGLSICRRIVEAHGGEIYCEANEQGGTDFIFTIKEEEK